jgi:YgiT-type zinc finger domain-containing protein
MDDDPPEDICPICDGIKKPGKTTFTSDLGVGVVVIRNVPATVCTQCGADWISDDTAAEIERLIEDARHKRSQVMVMALS